MRWRGSRRRAVLLLMLCLRIAGTGCDTAPATGPVEPTWDRDLCERCQMALSDRRFVAEIRMADDGRLRSFDDFGCASLWLDEQEAAGRSASELWVRSRDGERWLDAGKAYFVPGERTPMGYGLAAQSEAAEGALRLQAARERVREHEYQRRHQPR